MTRHHFSIPTMSTSSLTELDSGDDHVPDHGELANPNSDDNDSVVGLGYRTPPWRKSEIAESVSGKLRKEMGKMYRVLYGQEKALCLLMNTEAGLPLQLAHCVPRASKAEEVSELG